MNDFKQKSSVVYLTYLQSTMFHSFKILHQKLSFWKQSDFQFQNLLVCKPGVPIKDVPLHSLFYQTHIPS